MPAIHDAGNSANCYIDESHFFIFDSLPIGCCIFNEQYEIIYNNQRFLELFQIDETPTAEEFFRFAPDVQLDGTPSPTKALDYIQKVFVDGQVLFEWTHRDTTADDKKCRVSMIRLQGKNTTFAAGFILELESMAEKKANEKIRLKLMLDNTPLCCHYRDEQLSIVDCNQ